MADPKTPKKRGRGRPPKRKSKDVRISVAVSKEYRLLLERVSDIEKKSMSDCLRTHALRSIAQRYPDGVK